MFKIFQTWVFFHSKFCEIYIQVMSDENLACELKCKCKLYARFLKLSMKKEYKSSY